MLTHIHTAPTHGSPVVSADEIEAVAGSGIVGDRNFGRERQVTIVCSGELTQAGADLGIGEIVPGSTRRNLTVDLPTLPRSPGARITIGEVILEVRGDCAPCQIMESSVGLGASSALVGRSGVSARILVGGTLRAGDPVTIQHDRSAAD